MRMRIRRSRGALDGFILMLLGLAGGLVPFVGPYFDFTIGSDATWDFTWGRLWLSIVPAAAVALGGFILMTSTLRPTAVWGAWMATLGGMWFAVGQWVSTLWNDGVSAAGTAHGGTTLRAAEELGYFYGLGAVITALAAFALGRLAVRTVRDAAYADELAAARTADDDSVGRTGRFGRRPARFSRDRTVVDQDDDGVDDRDETPRRGFFSRLRR
jgi:hypothetical protein